MKKIILASIGIAAIATGAVILHYREKIKEDVLAKFLKEKEDEKYLEVGCPGCCCEDATLGEEEEEEDDRDIESL